MAKYKIVFYKSNGEVAFEEDNFGHYWSNEDAAYSDGEYMCGCNQQGADILLMNDPFDDEVDTDELTFEVIEVDD